MPMQRADDLEIISETRGHKFSRRLAGLHVDVVIVSAKRLWTTSTALSGLVSSEHVLSQHSQHQ